MRPVRSASGRKASGVSSPARVAPAHERFGANDLSARQIGLRLEEDDELLPRVDGTAQVGDECEPLGGIVILLGGIQRRHVCFLGQVEGDIRAAHECLRVGAVVWEERDPDARVDLEVDAADRQRTSQ